MRNQFLLLITGLFFLTLTSFAQQTITGKITDNNGAPLAGVSVKVKGSARGVVTNSAGTFSIQATATDVLEITYIGYKKQSVSVGSSTALDIKLESEVTELGEIVFIGTRSSGRAKTPERTDIDMIGTIGATLLVIIE